MWVLGNLPNFPFLMNNGLKAIAKTAIRSIPTGSNMPPFTLFILCRCKVTHFYSSAKESYTLFNLKNLSQDKINY